MILKFGGFFMMLSIVKKNWIFSEIIGRIHLGFVALATMAGMFRLVQRAAVGLEASRYGLVPSGMSPTFEST